MSVRTWSERVSLLRALFRDSIEPKDRYRRPHVFYVTHPYLWPTLVIVHYTRASPTRRGLEVDHRPSGGSLPRAIWYLAFATSGLSHNLYAWEERYGDWIIVDLGPRRKRCSHGRLIKFSAFTRLIPARADTMFHCSTRSKSVEYTVCCVASYILNFSLE